MKRTLHRPDGKPEGLFVFLHGYASGPDYLAGFLDPFLKAGFLVLTPTAPDHGNRKRGAGYPTLDEPEALLRHASAVIGAWVAELAEALPRWQAEHGLPLFAGGFSMGAYVWHELISRKLARPVAAALFGLGAIPNVAPPKGAELPIHRAEAYPPTALLQIHGAADAIVPLTLVEKTIAALRPAYAPYPGRLGLLAVEGAGHELTLGMASAGAGWLSAWRDDEPPAA